MPEQAIINAIHSLASEGKPISTATVKARLDSSVSLAALLPLISRYKQNPQRLPAQVATSNEQPAGAYSATEQALMERISELEDKVARLELQQYNQALPTTAKQEPHT